MKILKADSENFSRYGKVVSTPSGKPTSEGDDYRFWSDIANYNIEGETEVGICTVYKQEDEKIYGLERHLRTPEILIPIDAPFILPVESEDENKQLEYFQVDVGEAVIMNEAIWHGPCLPVGKSDSSYFVIFRRRTPYEDVEKKSLID
jgi:ureidoglycolate hydrolase